MSRSMAMLQLAEAGYPACVGFFRWLYRLPGRVYTRMTGSGLPLA
jgi:hypothetical protein